MENVNGQAETPEEFSEELTAEEQAYFDNEGVEPEQSGEAQPEAEAAAEEQKQEETAEPEKQSMVPHQALHAEREKSKGYKADLEQANERINRMLEMMRQPQEPEPQEYVPDLKSDPMGRVEYIDQRLAQMEQQRQQEIQEQQYFAQENEVVGTVVSALNEANQSDPSVAEAYNHMGNSLRQEAMAAGYNEQQAAAWAQEQERAHAIFVAQNQLDPAAYVKQLAGARGWTAQASKPAEQNVNTEADRIATANEAIDRQKSLSGAEGAAPASAVDVMSMSDDEFGAWLEKAGEEGWQKEVM